MKVFNKLSITTLVIACLFLSIYRISHVDKREISWDVLGYYLYLPSTFIYNEPMLDNYDWLKKINDEKQLTGTLYMVSSNDKWEPMYFFLMGMALFYLPFFLVAHGTASMWGYPADGFSLPYQYFLVIGGLIYMIIGLIFLRKILRNYFSERISSIVLLIIVFGTNYIQHLTLKNLETVNVLFMLVSIIVWCTIKWHEKAQTKYMVTVGASTALMALVKPSEVFIVLIPLLWNVTSLNDLVKKIQFVIVKNRKALLITIGVCFVIVLPQLSYWYIKTGSIVYDSYKNPGVGLDFLSPHLLEVLFSYRKGWLIYTPIMIFALIGFYFLYKNNRKIFVAILAYFLVSLYVISSWSEWWYGAGFSNRPLITTYPILAIPLGYIIQYMFKVKTPIKIAFYSIVIILIALNQFQWWQLKSYILDPYRTTKDYYWATFLKTSVSEEDKELLLIYRDFSGVQTFNNEENYNQTLLNQMTFDNFENGNIVLDNDSNSFYRMLAEKQFALTQDFKYKTLTKKDHLWIKAILDVRYPGEHHEPYPFLVMTLDRKEGVYEYKTISLKPDSISDQWKTFMFEYLTPEIRSANDHFKCYIWNRDGNTFDIDNFKLEKYEPIN